MKRICFLFITLLAFCAGCTHKSVVEKYQNRRNDIVNVRQKVTEIVPDDVLIGAYSRPFLMNKCLIIGDYKSSDKLIHLFDKDTFHHLRSIAPLGQGPGEITILGNIGIDEAHAKFYVSDHGKREIFSYDLDSVLADSLYMPQLKVRMNANQFPDRYQYINDTLCIGLVIEPTGTSGFHESVAKWNMRTGKVAPMKYKHPDIKKKRVSFAASVNDKFYVECYTYRDLMTICDLDGNLKYNIYGPHWSTKVTNRVHYYGNVTICGDKIVALYSGGDNSNDDYYPTKLLVFNKEGDYIKTLDTGYKIIDFCYDRDNNRIIMSLNDEIQFAYLDLDSIV